MTVRIAYNHDEDGRDRKPLPPPPRTEPELLEKLGVPLRAIPGVPDLMHHKYVVRDRAAVLTGSSNWTLDSWTREENVIVTVASEAIAQAYERDFDQLWERRRVDGTESNLHYRAALAWLICVENSSVRLCALVDLRLRPSGISDSERKR